MISIQNLFFFIFSSMVRSTKRIPKTLFIASTTIVGGISILFGQFASPARKNGDPFGRLMALLSLSLSSIHVGTCSNSPFSLAYFLTRSIISFFFFLSCTGLGGSRSLYLSQSEASFPSILLSRFSKTKMYLNTLKYSS